MTLATIRPSRSFIPNTMVLPGAPPSALPAVARRLQHMPHPFLRGLEASRSLRPSGIRFANLIADPPAGFVRHAQSALKLFAADAVPRRYEQVGRVDPQGRGAYRAVLEESCPRTGGRRRRSARIENARRLARALKSRFHRPRIRGRSGGGRTGPTFRCARPGCVRLGTVRRSSRTVGLLRHLASPSSANMPADLYVRQGDDLPSALTTRICSLNVLEFRALRRRPSPNARTPPARHVVRSSNRTTASALATQVGLPGSRRSRASGARGGKGPCTVSRRCC